MDDMTLEELARTCDSVYLDNSVLSQDVTPDQRRYGGFADILGATVCFSDIPLRRLYSQSLHASGLYDIVHTHAAVRTVPAVVSEYEEFVTHVAHKHRWLRGAGRRKGPGRKEQALQVVEDSHKQLLQILRGRSPQNTAALMYTALIHEHRMHVSHSASWGKKTAATEDICADADADLVAYAMLDAQRCDRVAIVSSDLDVINIVHNMGHHLRRSGASGHCSIVRAFFPGETWRQKWGLQFMTDTNGGYRRKDVVQHTPV